MPAVRLARTSRRSVRAGVVAVGAVLTAHVVGLSVGRAVNDREVRPTLGVRSVGDDLAPLLTLADQLGRLWHPRHAHEGEQSDQSAGDSEQAQV